MSVDRFQAGKGLALINESDLRAIGNRDHVHEIECLGVFGDVLRPDLWTELGQFTQGMGGLRELCIGDYPSRPNPDLTRLWSYFPGIEHISFRDIAPRFHPGRHICLRSIKITTNPARPHPEHFFGDLSQCIFPQLEEIALCIVPEADEKKSIECLQEFFAILGARPFPNLRRLEIRSRHGMIRAAHKAGKLPFVDQFDAVHFYLEGVYRELHYQSHIIETQKRLLEFWPDQNLAKLIFTCDYRDITQPAKQLLKKGARLRRIPQ